jgi:hypothetical protein
MAVPTIRSEISVRELQEQELSAAIGSSVVFGTSLGIPDPLQFSGNADYVHTTWRAHPERIVCRRMRWRTCRVERRWSLGSVTFFGPLAIRPDLWE